MIGTAVIVALTATLAFAGASAIAYQVRRPCQVGPWRTQYRWAGRWRRVRYLCTNCGVTTVWWYARGIARTGHTIDEWGQVWYRLACKCHRATP